ncbi:MAG: class I poly(R)-hydroxyalkanoic acid synthase [Phyllobacteriaceae bacterium]|nr:class I poly(R)-hydroxyalkanoic acid synthase [Phyllobacteriaceae bacterium]MBA89738.1 class I poly(R)-hydroxyalkanoic acid synthase [Phyllobacteriaceae bacterium]
MSKDGKDKKDSGPSTDQLDSYVVKDPEAFARNMAKAIEAAGKAASNWIAPREEGKVDPMAEPMADMVKTFSKVGEYWLSDPARALDAQTRLFSNYMTVWTNSVRRATGDVDEDAVKPEKGDKRFADPEWENNAFFDFLKQTYLVTSRWAHDLVTEADGLDPKTRHKAEFYVDQISNAISPSNFLLTNPELYRETIASNGENIVRGMQMLAEDIEAGQGDLKIRQVDASPFKVGVNMANTPGKVIARSETAEIIQYEAATETVLKRPLLIVPPWINKFYILDLNKEKSFIRWLTEQGHTVFVVSWVNPDERHRKKTWEAYIEEGIVLALDSIEAATGEREVNAIGYCVGGTLLAAALAMFARDGERRIRSATFFTTQVDFTYGGDLLVFVDEDQVKAVERQMETKGYLDGGKMATAFNMLRSRELIWNYAVNNYMRGKTPMAFDLLYWNSDSTRMTAANHSFYLRNCYLENNLSKGTMKLGGAPVHLEDIKIPVYNLATREDHIAPAKSVFHGCRFFGGDVQYVMAGSGHIAGVVNPPDKVKYQYWTGGKPEGSFEDWVASAHETPGSWWPHWQAWIESMETGERVKARRIGGKKLKALCDAPGEYVLARV